MNKLENRSIAARLNKSIQAILCRQFHIYFCVLRLLNSLNFKSITVC